MSTVLMIPARYASARFPGKPLAELTQPDGSRKSLIRMSWEAACRVRGVEAVHVVTDDDRIREAAEGFGASVLMTPESCRNGTERCAAALERLGTAPEVVVNFQGDAPLTPPWFVEELIAGLEADPGAGMATPVLRCDAWAYARLREDRQAGRVGGTTAVFDGDHRALYFSKEVIPYVDPAKGPEAPPVYHHVGVYAYRPAALRDYIAQKPGPLETLEGLEQLRFLENGLRVRCVEVEGRGRVFWELNNPEDAPRIEALLKEQA